MKYDTAELRMECARLTGGNVSAARELLAWVLEGYEEAAPTVTWADVAKQQREAYRANFRCRPTGPAREVEWPCNDTTDSANRTRVSSRAHEGKTGQLP